MKDLAEAYILQAKSGQWMVEVWRDGEPVQCVAGLATELDAVEEASNVAEGYEGLEFVITQSGERPSP